MEELKRFEVLKAVNAVSEKLKKGEYNKKDIKLLSDVIESIEKATGHMTTRNVLLGELIARELNLPEHYVCSATAKMFSMIEVRNLQSVQTNIILDPPIEDELTSNTADYLRELLSAQKEYTDHLSKVTFSPKSTQEELKVKELKSAEVLKAMIAVNKILKGDKYNKIDMNNLLKKVTEKIENADGYNLTTVTVFLGELIAQELKLPEQYVYSAIAKMFSVIDVEHKSVETIYIPHSPIEDELVSNVSIYLQSILSSKTALYYNDDLLQKILSAKMILHHDADDEDTVELKDIDKDSDSCSDECINISSSLMYVGRKSKIDERINEAIDKIIDRRNFINEVITNKLKTSSEIVTPKVLFSEALELHDLFESNMDGKIHGNPFDKNLNMSYDVLFDEMVIEFAITVVTNDGTTVTDLPDSLVRYKIPQKYVDKYNKVEAKVKDLITAAYFEIAAASRK